ncbi:MAG: SDR family NAD(P)-dependent oxidoreductase [Microthrixaceae bacterium]
MADNDIAIVGLAAHLPGAANPTAYWRNLVDGVESIRELSEQELVEAGVGEAELRSPNYVRSAAPLDGVFDFDADFFGLSPKEAGIMDPQHRHFLMAAWEAMEDAGHVPSSFDGAIGVFAGCGMGSYFMRNLLSNPDLVRDVGVFLLRHTGNDKDFLATRASYSLNLRGPSVNVQTACSTSLVATHLAVQHLLSGECDLALAGGSTIEIPHGQGYVYHEGEVLSPDGHCRAFDHRSQGTVFGSGAGVVALRRLDDALDDGDRIYAVIKGTAVNNDGDQKVGYLAPSVDGQAACVSEAIAVSDVDADSIQYVECHGTGTPMGDPIEVAALAQAFDLGPTVTGSCRIGSVKTNIGHLDTAAGAAGLIKVALSLHHGALPASLNFERPNPNLELDDTPFVVNDHLTPWTSGSNGPRRAGVNSLGVGGTNAFAVLEEAPAEPERRDPSGEPGTAESERWHLLTLSARSRGALDEAGVRLADHLADNLDLPIEDVARTLFVGRHHFDERRVLAVRDVADAIVLLRSADVRRLPTHTATTAELGLTFMFPGGGSQHLGMGADLHRCEPAFAAQVDRGLGLLRDRHQLDLADLLLGEDRSPELDTRLASMTHQLPLIFIIEHALAHLLMSWGLEPSALVGHSLGENTAACVAGTISFEDCLGLVVLRGRLMDTVEGAAVAVPLTPDDVAEAVERLALDLAVVNAPDVVVVSGPQASLDLFEQEIRESGIEPLPVQVTTPVHSRLLDPVLEQFGDYLRGIELHPPTIPWVSNTTGTWITTEQATDPEYWVRHLRSTVRFADDVATLAAAGPRVLLEVGPGKTLSSLVRAHPTAVRSNQVAVPAMRHPEEETDDNAALLTAVGRIWAAGSTIEADRWFPADGRRTVGLPTYPFQTQTFFIAPGAGVTESDDLAFVSRESDVDRWSWKPVWKSKDREDAVDGPNRWLVLADAAGFADEVVAELRATGDSVVVVRMGDLFRAVSDDEYVLSPELGLAGYESLVKDLVRTDRLPDRVAHLSLLATDDRDFRPGSSFFHRNQELGFQSLVYLAQAWASAGVQRSLAISVATMGSQSVPGSDAVPFPEQATVLGPVQVIPREFADVSVSTFDLDPAQVADAVGVGRRQAGSIMGRIRSATSEAAITEFSLIDEVVAEVRAPLEDSVVALRGDRRYVRDVRRTRLPEPDRAVLRRHGVVLITGGLGGIGLSVAEALYRERGARVALLARRGLPPRDTWDEVLGRLGNDHPTAVRIRGVRSLEEEGAEVIVVEGDVTDPESLNSAVARVRSEFGTLNGVVHAAGVIDDALLVTKSPMQMEDVLAPKVYGTLVLETATASDHLDLFVVFSSTSTVTAPIGQVDYVAANSFLNAFAESRRARGDRHVRAVNWGVWDEVGMAAAAAAVDSSGDIEDVELRQAVHPFFGELRRAQDGVVRLSIDWNERDSWPLDEHRTGDGDAVVAGATYLELARASLAELGLERPFEMRDLTFLRPLAVDADGNVSAEVVLRPTESGYSFEIRERVSVTSYGGEGEVTSVRVGWRLTGEADLLLHPLDPADSVELARVLAGCDRRGATRTRQQDHLRFGPRWDVVTEVRYGDRTAVAELKLKAPYDTEDLSMGLHPALVDLGTGFAMDLIPGYTGDRLWVPVEYRRVRIHDRLPSELTAVAEVLSGTSEKSGVASFDVLLCDRDGRVLVEVEGFAVKRLEGRLEVGGRPALAAEVDFDGSAGARQRTLPELALESNLRQGIRPIEGGREFLRTIGPDVDPVVYVTSLDLPALSHQGDLIAAEQIGSSAGGEASAVFSRPKLDSEFVAARNDVEEQLVVMWQELLGIDQVGVRDNFFDLGGHSLIAVRLFAQIKRTFSVDFPISVLVEAPTVEACAELISEALPSDDGDLTSESSIVAAKPRYRYLVALHPGDGSDRTPFFLVAGMFGNVLNLRHLAHQIGADRPFYGIQARGLFGDDPPHEDFVEMAQEYLEELRSVQPHGPYLLGGFSGGGIAAFEMAQQLRAAGEETSLLVLLDTPLPDQPPLRVSDRVKIQLDNIREEGASYVRSWARNRIAWEKERRRRAAGPAVGPDTTLHSEVIEAAFYRALERYDVRPYEGTVTLYRPRLTPAHVFGPDRQIDINRRFVYFDNGWGPYCRRVQVTEVPGDHDSMVLEPAVRVLAGHIRSAITDAESSVQSNDATRSGMATAS